LLKHPHGQPGPWSCLQSDSFPTAGPREISAQTNLLLLKLRPNPADVSLMQAPRYEAVGVDLGWPHPQGLPVAERSRQTFRPSEAWEHASADRRAFYQRRASMRPAESSRFYQTLLRERYAFLVPPGSSVVELGCGLGDLLAAVKPARGVGI